MVLFASKSCGHCTDVLPQFKKATAHIDSKIVYMDTKDPEHAEMIRDLDVRLVPTIMFIKDKLAVVYKGDRSAADIERFAKKSKNARLKRR